MVISGRVRILIVGLTALLGGQQSALAADLGGSPSTVEERSALRPFNQWVVTLTPYSWLPFLAGDQTIKGRTVEIDVDPIEVLERLSAIPWMSYAEARNGPLTLYNDIVYSKLGIAGSRAKSVSGLTVGASVDGDIELAIIELGGAYQIFKWWSGGGGSVKDGDTFARSTAIDVLAGARYWHQDMAIKLALTGGLDTDGLVLSGARAIAREGSVDWVDPLIGLRVRHQLAPGQELMLRGDVGGFDVGSQFSWNVTGAFSFDLAMRDGILWSGVLGYRALSVDYEKGSGSNKYEYDVLQHGPILGMTAKF